MGVLFQRMKIHTTSSKYSPSSVAVWEDAEHPRLTPLLGITRYVDEGTASKVSSPYIHTISSGEVNKVEYRTIWVPLGQEGWTIKIQATLKYTDSVDEIGTWLTVDTGQLLYVASNNCDSSGRSLNSIPKYDRLEPGSLWYVDKILIMSINGVVSMARIELTLVRCWQYQQVTS